MATSFEPVGEPWDSENKVEAMSVEFELNDDLIDITDGVNLVGTLIADVEPGVGGIKSTLTSIWRTLGQIRIIRVKPNTYSLTVGSEKLARKLLLDSPWNVKGYCFTIRHWPRYHSIEDLEDKRAIYWIQGHGVPREMITPNNGRKLGNMIGSVLEAGVLPRPYMAPTKIYLKYEKLMSFCFNCGRLGHLEGACTFRVHPTLLKLGVVYDRNLVAESLQKPVFTQGTFPTEHPYIPTTGIFKRGNTRGKTQISNSREGESRDRDISATA